MSLVRLIYGSEKSETFRPDDVSKLLAQAQKRNREAGVTGLLCFNRRWFLQSLEGSVEAVNETFSRIVRDDRHRKLTLLAYGPIPYRSFPEWDMGYVPDSELTHEVVFRHAPTDSFLPCTLSGESALALLLALGPVVLGAGTAA